MKNINSFFKENEIEFSSDKQKIRWIRQLKPKSLVRVGKSYFVDEKELKKLFEDYLLKKRKVRSYRVIHGRQKGVKNLKPRRTIKKISTPDE